jgi:hypothetical protein
MKLIPFVSDTYKHLFVHRTLDTQTLPESIQPRRLPLLDLIKIQIQTQLRLSPASDAGTLVVGGRIVGCELEGGSFFCSAGEALFECERVFGSAKGRQEEELVREKMSSVGRKKGLLEVFKFATYVAIPVVMMYAFANNSENLEKIIRNVSLSFSVFTFEFSGLG